MWEQYRDSSLSFKLHKLPFTQPPKYFLRNFFRDEWTGQNRLLSNAIRDKPFCTFLPRNLGRKDLFVSSQLFDVVVHYSILNTLSISKPQKPWGWAATFCSFDGNLDLWVVFGAKRVWIVKLKKKKKSYMYGNNGNRHFPSTSQESFHNFTFLNRLTLINNFFLAACISTSPSGETGPFRNKFWTTWAEKSQNALILPTYNSHFYP